MTDTLALGKLDPKYDKRTFSFERYAEHLTLDLPPSSDVDNLDRIARNAWAMLGNDQVGDCVFAGADHETMSWLMIGGHNPSEAQSLFSAKTALADYSAVTGYTPSDPNSDQGTVVLDALNYRRKTGLVDTKGQRHKIGAYVALEPGNTAHVKEAVHLFDAVGIGIKFPASAMDQFNAGRPWTVVSGSPIEGGHYVPVIGYSSRAVYCVTWGQVQRMTWGFFKTFCDEAYGLLSPEFLRTGKSPEGFDLATLTADITALAH